jgi:methyl-accepting chemotaxis protein
MHSLNGDSRTEHPGPTVMSGAAPDAKQARGTGGLIGRFFGRRRVFLLNAGYQVRTALVAVLGMAFLLAFAAALFHLLSQENARLLAQKIPGPGRSAGGDARSVLYLVAAGIIFVAAVFVVEILETHKTAGVIYKVTRGLQEIEAGRWGAKIALRKHDNFKEMEEAFNAAARSLRDRVEDDLRGLQAVEGQIRLLSRELEGGNREGALLLMRQVASELQNQRERRRDMLRSQEILTGRHKV